MTKDLVDLTMLIDHMEGTAEWRREKAREYPDDRRNVVAAEILEALAKEVRNLTGSPAHAAFSAQQQVLLQDDDQLFKYHEAESEYLRRVGFSYFPESGEAFLRDLAALPDY